MNDEKLEHMTRQVDEIHGFLFGVQGQGGLARRVADLEIELQRQKSTLGKIVGIGIAFSGIMGAVGGKILNLVSGSK